MLGKTHHEDRFHGRQKVDVDGGKRVLTRSKKIEESTLLDPLTLWYQKKGRRVAPVNSLSNKSTRRVVFKRNINLGKIPQKGGGEHRGSRPKKKKLM